MTIYIFIFLILIIAILSGLPVAFSLGFSSLIQMIVGEIPLKVFPQTLGLGINSFVLLAVPFYILAGQLMNSGGITKRLFDFAKHLVGPLRGGLAQVNILASLIFAGMTGAATADAAGLGIVEIKAMKDAGYDRDFTVAVTAASSTVGPIIPPSIIMVVYGVTAEVSIGRLFMGGILPGIIMAAGLAILTYIIACKRNYPREERPEFRTLFRSFLSALPALIAPLIIVGGILGGVFTATEAGAVAVLYALIVGIFIYKELKLRDLPKLFLDSMSTTAAILFIVGAAKVFSWVLTYFRFPTIVANQITTLTTDPIAVTLLLVSIYLFLGCFLEASAIVVMTIPVVAPLLSITGIDPVFFGVLVAMCMSIGTLTPPLGLVMYVVCNIGEISISEYLRAIWPYLVLLIGMVIIMVFFPKFVLYIPNLVMGGE